MIILLIILFKSGYSNIKINEDTPIITPYPSHTPVPTLSPSPSVSPTPPPSRTPTRSFEIYVMNPLQSNAVSPTLSVIAVVSLSIVCTAGFIYIIFYILPFLREDFYPLL